MIRKVTRHPMYYGGVKQTYPHIKPGMPFFSKTVVVGNIVFLSSFDGRSIEKGKILSERFEEQLVVCLDNIRNALD